MKHLSIIIATVLSLAFSTQVVADDVIMFCDANEGGRYYKFVNPLLWRASVKQKVEGLWLDWCGGGDKNQIHCKIKVLDSSAKRVTVHKSIPAMEDVLSMGVKKGDRLLRTMHIFLDFEFERRSVKRLYIASTSPTTSGHVESLKTVDHYPCKIQ